MHKLKVAVVGATGYTGAELMRILLQHPEVEVVAVTSETKQGQAFTDIFPHFTGITDLKLISVEALASLEVELVFLALPHGISMSYVARFAEASFSMIDLSGDFRLPSPSLYETWYQKPHTYPSGFSRAVYGLPELCKEEIQQAHLIANPGCYPTTSLLGLAPLAIEGLIKPQQIIIDAKSGTTGAGIKPKDGTHFPHVHDNFRAYGLATHRHTIEIESILQQKGGEAYQVQFTPHLLPIDRGILATSYVQPKQSISSKALIDLYQAFYKDRPFVRVRTSLPTLKDIRSTNLCDIYPFLDPRTGRIIILSALDNLVKGAAGQAVQNMNLMRGWEETLGLGMVPLYP